jgi:phosphoribosylformylglycinamidine synthase II
MSSLYRFVVYQKDSTNPKALRLLEEAHILGLKEIQKFDYADVYFIEGNLTSQEQQLLGSKLLTDSFMQEGHWENEIVPISKGQVVEIALLPGVTDVVAEQIIRCARLLDISGVQRAVSGQRIVVHSQHNLESASLKLLTEKLLSNTVIQHYSFGHLTHLFLDESQLDHAQVLTEIIPLRTLSTTQLNLLSQERRSALDEAEMSAIQKYFKEENRDPTEVEFEMIAQTWSEHCSHKTFKADIHIDDKTIHGLLNSYIRKATEEIAAPWVYSAFVDNAGIIDFDDEFHVSFKVETHNHPSAIEPFGGANTGLGGVIRDVLGVSAKPIAATDVFCFGLPETLYSDLPQGILHPRLISSGVIAGVQDYGNKTGIPTVNGAVCYDSAYVSNPLVFCGCVGLAPKNSHPRNPQKEDRVIVIGGRTGRDGLRGATFSSLTMDAMTGAVAGASVQIGDPIIARGLIEVVTRARDERLYHAITDCGAGGLSSAVGEMAGEIGAQVELSFVPLKYPGLRPWEIWLSEAQERMVLAVPEKNLPALQKICDLYDVELTNIGQFTNTKEIVVNYHHQCVLRLSNEFLHHGMPEKKLVAAKNSPAALWRRPPFSTGVHSASPCEKEGNISFSHEEMLLKILSHPNVASKENIIRRYDHEVQGGTVVKPFAGIRQDGPQDACVLKPAGTKGVKGLVLSNGINPELGKIDPYAMAISVVDEAIRNAIAVGADPDKIAILDNFCWGDPKRPETLYALVEAARGCHDAALHYRTPFISGKDSLNNEFVGTDGQRHAIPSTLLISAIGIIQDINTAVTMDFKSAGNCIYLMGETQSHLLGSYFQLLGGEVSQDEKEVPALPQYTSLLYRSLHQAMTKKLVRSCHDLSEGGLSVALAEMCIAGRTGCEIDLNSTNITTSLFSESNGRFVVEVAPEQSAEFEVCFPSSLSSMIQKIGTVSDGPLLNITQNKNSILRLTLPQLTQAFFKQSRN